MAYGVWQPQAVVKNSALCDAWHSNSSKLICVNGEQATAIVFRDNTPETCGVFDKSKIIFYQRLEIGELRQILGSCKIGEV